MCLIDKFLYLANNLLSSKFFFLISLKFIRLRYEKTQQISLPIVIVDDEFLIMQKLHTTFFK